MIQAVDVTFVIRLQSNLIRKLCLLMENINATKIGADNLRLRTVGKFDFFARYNPKLFYLTVSKKERKGDCENETLRLVYIFNKSQFCYPPSNCTQIFNEGITRSRFSYPFLNWSVKIQIVDIEIFFVSDNEVSIYG